MAKQIVNHSYDKFQAEKHLTNQHRLMLQSKYRETQDARYLPQIKALQIKPVQ